MVDRQEWLMERMEPDLESGCWLWSGYVDRHGYGRTTLSEDGVVSNERVHLLADRLWNGLLPPGFTVDHICRKRRCFRPDHLQRLPEAKNKRYVVKRDGSEFCLRGHPFSVENTGWNGGKRYCRECAREKQRERRSRKR